MHGRFQLSLTRRSSIVLVSQFPLIGWSTSLLAGRRSKVALGKSMVAFAPGNVAFAQGMVASRFRDQDRRPSCWSGDSRWFDGAPSCSRILEAISLFVKAWSLSRGAWSLRNSAKWIVEHPFRASQLTDGKALRYQRKPFPLPAERFFRKKFGRTLTMARQPLYRHSLRSNGSSGAR
jgi:hypothetical protein